MTCETKTCERERCGVPVAVNQYLHCAGGQPIRIRGSAVHRAYNMFRNSAPNVSSNTASQRNSVILLAH